MLQLYDIGFTIFHSAFILFVLFGWMHPRTQRIHQFALLFTLIAWLLIGWYVGTIGYCPLTDWQWDIKRQLGERNLPSSFTEYVGEKLTGLDLNKTYVDIVTAAGLAFGVIMAVIKYVQSRIRRS
ncbi:MAG: DUF2784 domain-containing protein [Cyclobacteriaceae bacterium]|nr:DUF2784 domain-containing protein [Cyclobacteriaceae bacterium SS2]